MKKTCEHTEWTDKRLISDVKIIVKGIGGGWSDANVRITVRCPTCHEKLSMVTGCFGGVTISGIVSMVDELLAHHFAHAGAIAQRPKTDFNRQPNQMTQS